MYFIKTQVNFPQVYVTLAYFGHLVLTIWFNDSLAFKSFDYGSTCWMSFQKRVVWTNYDIYIFTCCVNIICVFLFVSTSHFDSMYCKIVCMYRSCYAVSRGWVPFWINSWNSWNFDICRIGLYIVIKHRLKLIDFVWQNVFVMILLHYCKTWDNYEEY